MKTDPVAFFYKIKSIFFIKTICLITKLILMNMNSFCYIQHVLKIHIEIITHEYKIVTCKYKTCLYGYEVVRFEYEIVSYESKVFQ